MAVPFRAMSKSLKKKNGKPVAKPKAAAKVLPRPKMNAYPFMPPGMDKENMADRKGRSEEKD